MLQGSKTYFGESIIGVLYGEIGLQILFDFNPFIADPVKALHFAILV